MGEGEKETDEDMSEAVGHGTILVFLWDDILTAVVEISTGECHHRSAALTGRSLRVMTGDSSETDWVEVSGFEGSDDDGEQYIR